MSSLSSSSSSPIPQSIRVSSSSSAAAVKEGTTTKTSSSSTTSSTTTSTSTTVFNKAQLEEKNKNIHYEFGGPVGTFFIIIGLPVVIYFLFFICNKDICYISSSSSSSSISSESPSSIVSSVVSFDWNEFCRYILSNLSWNKLFSIEATYIYIGMI
jgi:hypothetical protein